MIIKQDNIEHSVPIRPIITWVLVVASLVILFFLFFKNRNTTMTKTGDMTVIGFDKIFGEYYDKEQTTKIRNLRTSEEHRSGNYSVKVDTQNRFGPTMIIDKPDPGCKYQVSIWRKINNIRYSSYLSVKGEDSNMFYLNTTDPVEQDGDWEKLSLKFNIPFTNTPEKILISIYQNGPEDNGGIYFDDFILENFGKDSLDIFNSIPRVTLYFDNDSSRKLDEYAKKGLSSGILLSENKQFVQAKIIDGESEQNVKVRLKGDWVDHLEGRYRSYRVKTKREESWNRLQEFSLMRPDKRNMVIEWLFHKVLEDNDILTPNYEFIYLRENDREYVPYVVEEHFAKQLIESSNRREGIIFKLDEEAVWQQRLRNKQIGISTMFSDDQGFSNSQILSFDEKGVESDSTKMVLFSEAIEKMELFINGKRNAESLMDLELFAKYFAIVELFNAHHSVIWHNMRFYYNPITKLIEPIGFDGSIGNDAEFKEPFFKCLGCKLNHYKYDDWIELYKKFYQQPTFIKHFSFYLDKFTNEQYIEGLLGKYNQEIFQYEQFLKQDYQDYTFDFSNYSDRSKKLQLALRPFNNSSVKCYTIAESNGNKRIVITNNFNLPIEVSGTAKSVNEIENRNFDSTYHFILNNPYNRLMYFDTIEVRSQDKYILYRVPGLEQLYYSKIRAYANTSHDGFTEEMELSIPLGKNEFEVSVNKEISISPGQHSIKMPFLIPKGYSLTIPGGTSLDLNNNAYILSYSPIKFLGSENHPIQISSSDKSGRGLSVFSCKENESKILYTRFTDQKNLNIDGYYLSGSINFYESDIHITSSEISSNNCEDALNIIRSKFVLNNLHIHHTAADAFDSDFSYGIVEGSRFNDTGNDAADFSGSNVEIRNCYFYMIGDKAISVGEESKLKISNVEIEKAIIGVASKDLSQTNIDGISLKNVNTGFTAFQKKPEYGGGRIDVKNYQGQDIKQLQILDEKSKINIK